jgi:fructosamine-3-kinase
VTGLPTLCGPEPRPSLLHGDAQQNNFISTPAGAVAVDAAPYYGHPEIDLALLDFFQPVPDDVFDAYRDITPIDPRFEQRRELWRVFGYLAVVTVEGQTSFGHRFLARLTDAVHCYR